MQPVAFADVWETRMPAETYDQQVIAAHDALGPVYGADKGAVAYGLRYRW